MIRPPLLSPSSVSAATRSGTGVRVTVAPGPAAAGRADQLEKKVEESQEFYDAAVSMRLFHKFLDFKTSDSVQESDL